MNKHKSFLNLKIKYMHFSVFMPVCTMWSNLLALKSLHQSVATLTSSLGVIQK